MNAKIVIVFSALLLMIAALAGQQFLTWSYPQTSVPGPQPMAIVEKLPQTVDEVLAAETTVLPLLRAVFGDPISQARRRVTKKPFGLEIIPGHSPVENDRFSGFHVGVDFETFADEAESDVAIFAVCDGPLVLKGFAKGYGGVAVQECELSGEKVSVIYGHLKEESIEPDFKEHVTAGQKIAVLGKGHSPETDGVRKHLHLGVRVGSTEDIRGYVKDPLEMEQWRNILQYISE